jgi:indole-3-glycerol phosphate synthase
MKRSFLEDVIAYKKQCIRRSKIAEPLSYLRNQIRRLPKPRSLSNAILKGSGIIAEIKRRSPSRHFGKVNDIIALAEVYEKNGACAISVLTDEKFFGGSLLDLQQVKAAVSVPVLRKDFIIDEYQIYQSRAYGADAVLLIASVMDDPHLMRLYKVVRRLGIEALIEVHNQGELMAVMDLFFSKQGVIMGINNRDLRTLKVDLETSRYLLLWVLMPMIRIVESGIHTRRQIREFFRRGADGFLIGEALLESPSPGKRLRELIWAAPTT